MKLTQNISCFNFKKIYYNKIFLKITTTMSNFPQKKTQANTKCYLFYSNFNQTK